MTMMVYEKEMTEHIHRSKGAKDGWKKRKVQPVKQQEAKKKWDLTTEDLEKYLSRW